MVHDIVYSSSEEVHERVEYIMIIDYEVTPHAAKAPCKTLSVWFGGVRHLRNRN